MDRKHSGRAPAASLATDLGGVVARANRAASALLGVAPASLRDRPLAAFVGARDRRAFQAALHQLPDVPWVEGWPFELHPGTRPPVTVTATVVRFDGCLRWTLHEVRAPEQVADPAQLEALVDQLQHALTSRVAIERAKGVLMERKGVDEVTAFELMRGVARSSRRQVAAVADDVLRGVPVH